MTSLHITGPLAAYRARLVEGRLRPDPAQALAAEKLEGLCKALRGYQPHDGTGGWRERLGLARRPDPAPMGLYLFGGVGRGKSMLMDLFFTAASVANKRRVHFNAFMVEVHQRLHKWRQRDLKDRESKDPIAPLAKKIAEEAWLLCFDEFQVTNIADAMILGRLFAALFERGVVVVATSNIAPDDLYEGGLQRELFLPSIAMLRERLDLLELDGDVDYRRERLRGLPVYYTPLGAEATARLEAVFTKLAMGDKGKTARLAVLGRELCLPRAAKGAAMADFSSLCEQAFGAADYLALARHFHTLVLDGVKTLRPEMRNEARRFVLLIDSLYEHRVNLVCAAEAPPEALYPSGQHAAEFRRTVSRLHEMQSADYLESPHLT
jgi:cell division protein ZapE